MFRVTGISIGYARVSTNDQDLLSVHKDDLPKARDYFLSNVAEQSDFLVDVEKLLHDHVMHFC